MEGFKALGLSYKNAPIEVRENVAFEESEAADFLIKLRDVLGVEEALLISTCNRTELYYSSSKEIAEPIIGLIAAQKGLSAKTIQNHFKSLDAKEATQHLFRVSLSLESQVIGDIQISNQVKRAYQQSADLNLAGPYLHRLLHTIFFANKRVVQETRLQDGTASVASVAVDLIEGFISKMEDPRIALIGLGEIGQNVLENLGDNNATITVANRTLSKAEELADGSNLIVRDFSELEQIVNENDVIISAVSSKTSIITKDTIDSKHHHKLFVDLSVPRSINPEIEQIPGIALYNVDQLSERTIKARKVRESAIPEAEKIITESLTGFNSWKSEMEVSPTIQKLKSALDSIRKEELARHSKISDQEKELLEVVTKNMIQKVIKLPVLQLKAACKRGDAENLVDVLNDLFNLEQQKTEKK
ncbi:MAG: glutamyl-tRNA reductase [Bacteroidota bacterium]